MTAPAAVGELVERFDSHRDACRSGQYNQTQLRREFLAPFFEALGWDVHSRQGYVEAYKEVIHEGAIEIGGRTKAPDYCFRACGRVRSTSSWLARMRRGSVSLIAPRRSR